MQVGELVTASEQKKGWFREDYDYDGADKKLLAYYLQRHKIVRIENDRLYIKYPKWLVPTRGREWYLKMIDAVPVRKTPKPCHCGWHGCKRRGRKTAKK